MTWMEWWEMASYVVTVIGLPLAIWVFLAEQRKERQNDDDEVFQSLSSEYAEFLKVVLANADLRLFSQASAAGLSEEQRERRGILFQILVDLFERAYLLVWEERMTRQNHRLWRSWEDYMREWCRRPDFREALPPLLEGEDPDFVAMISRLAAEEAPRG